jgi:hypothetical protein
MAVKKPLSKSRRVKRVSRAGAPTSKRWATRSKVVRKRRLSAPRRKAPKKAPAPSNRPKERYRQRYESYEEEGYLDEPERGRGWAVPRRRGPSCLGCALPILSLFAVVGLGGRALRR